MFILTRSRNHEWWGVGYGTEKVLNKQLLGATTTRGPWGCEWYSGTFIAKHAASLKYNVRWWLPSLVSVSSFSGFRWQRVKVLIQRGRPLGLQVTSHTMKGLDQHNTGRTRNRKTDAKNSSASDNPSTTILIANTRDVLRVLTWRFLNSRRVSCMLREAGG